MKRAPAHRGFWWGIVFCAVALSGCSSSATGVGVASKLVFTVQPSNATVGAALAPAVQVAVQDAQGHTVTTATTSITVAIGTNPGNGTLSGAATVAAVRGVATFSTLNLNRAATGYTLTASATGLTSATSSVFIVVTAFAAVSAGDFHSCGVTAAGAAYCWGYNVYGELGDGTTTDRWSPVLVAGGVNFAGVRAGGASYTCGVTAAGAGYCWGHNANGELGDGTTSDRANPVLVTGGVSFAAVNAGYYYTCGVTATGAAYCWGDNAYGQLGDGTTTNRSSPVPVAGGVIFVAVSAGYAHTCGVTAAGAAYCWGDNAYGELGDGTTTNRSSPVPVAGGMTFAAMSAGYSHTCGVTTAGAAYCWGYNFIGQLGDGTRTNRSSPVQVAGGMTFAAVSAGYYHTCGVTAASAAYCWGDDGNGELGDGTGIGTLRLTPVPVAGGVSFAAVSAGYFHTCGVTAAGVAYCWGDNAYGGLGDGTTTARVSPVLVVQ